MVEMYLFYFYKGNKNIFPFYIKKIRQRIIPVTSRIFFCFSQLSVFDMLHAFSNFWFQERAKIFFALFSLAFQKAQKRKKKSETKNWINLSSDAGRERERGLFFTHVHWGHIEKAKSWHWAGKFLPLPPLVQIRQTHTKSHRKILAKQERIY